MVPAISLIDQTVRSFWDDGIRDIGVIQADHPLTDASHPIQVASVQTLIRRSKPVVGLVIVDECHRGFNSFTDWIASSEMANVPVIGLSATPWAKGMAKHWDDLIICATTADMIDRGYLSPFRVFAPSHPDLSGVKIMAGDYHEGQLAEAMNKTVLVADIVETWIRMGEGRPTLCFAVDCAHARSIQERFEASGIPCGYIDAYSETDEREIVRKKFHSGQYKVVCNVGTLTTGLDWDVRCIILARPTKSEMLYVQIIGRALRTAEGKADALILDHSDTTSRLGFVTDIHHTVLDDGKPKGPSQPKKERLPKECPKCHNLRPAGVSQCPNCGFKPEPGQSKIEAEDGELVEMTKPKNGAKLNGHVMVGSKWIPHGEFYGQLCQYAIERGYKSGWASNQYREMVGVWPNAHKSQRPIDVSSEVNSWIRSRMIRFAKKRS